MKVSILICSVAKDFRYLKYCLRSISKFATGFHRVLVMVPATDVAGAMECGAAEFRGFDEWPGKGMLHHMYHIMCSDLLLPDSDFILHMDSDCVFTEPVTPAEYFVDGKPVLLHASFDHLCTEQPALLRWKIAVDKALGWNCTDETMRRHPAVHYRELYGLCRARIEMHTKQSTEDYIRSGRNEFPQEFCEFDTLGWTAWMMMRQQYHWINTQHGPNPRDKVYQAWSHREPTCADMDVYKALGIYE